MENVLPGIFNTPVVGADNDIFWEDSIAKGLTAKDTLVISTPFEAGSAEEIQLLKMLGACKLQAADYHILQLCTGERLAWHQLRESTKASKILLLGILPVQLGIAAMMVQHEVNHFNNAQWIPTIPLEHMLSNSALKQHLWANVLKHIYGV